MTVRLPYSNVFDSKACVLFVEQQMKQKQTQNKKQASMNAMQVKQCQSYLLASSPEHAALLAYFFVV